MKSLILKISAALGAVILGILLVYTFLKEDNVIVSTVVTSETDEIVNGIHISTGLKATENYKLVVTNCTSCHSAKLVTQNRMTKNQWNATIKWMQETQNLWDLGSNQEIIINYLVDNYPVTSTGRRANLNAVEWYALDN